MIEFDVYSRPATQGSKKTVPIYRNGKPVMKDGRPLMRIVEQIARLPHWRQEVAYAANRAYQGPLLTGAIRLVLTFWRPRPKAHFGTGRNADKLKSSAPRYPITTPDLTKLTRAIEDALTGEIWKDDSQIVEQVISKRFGTRFCVHVWISELDN